MATQTLKYGTIVLLGLAVTGGLYYESARRQVYAKDCIEIIEGVREREMIATAISGTNRITIQIATNRASLVALDSVIVDLIPYFVNQTQIATWAAGSDTNPPHWTAEDLYAHLGLSESGMTPYPYQIRKAELEQRFNILEHLVYTDTASAWSASRYGNIYSSGDALEFGDQTTNFPLDYRAGPWPTNQATGVEWWNTYGADTEPDWWGDGCVSTERTVEFDGYPTSWGSMAATYPSFSWSIGIGIQLYLAKIGDYDYMRDFGGTIKISIRWYKYWWSKRNYSSAYVESKLSTTTKSIPITRADYFYTDILVCTTNISSNTASSVSSWIPPTGSSFTNSATFSRERCVDEELRFYNWGYNGINWAVDFTPTNSTEYVWDYHSGSVSNDIKRNVIHKWDVERCRDE